MSEEIFDIVDDRDRVIGKQTRQEVHRRGVKHRAIHLLVVNERGEVYLQKRSFKKDTFPGAWDSSSSGHVNSGESYDACAVREPREEIGLFLKRTPKRLFKIDACAQTGQEFVWVYRSDFNGPFRLNPDEVECGAFFKVDHVNRWMAERPRDFADSFRLVWKYFLNPPQPKPKVAAKAKPAAKVKPAPKPARPAKSKPSKAKSVKTKAPSRPAARKAVKPAKPIRATKTQRNRPAPKSRKLRLR
ncbi:MAG: NUDIX hydrolase [Pedosphaera sp. Tous-C6FEB]|nr:MAG: NUDIX hydrolase [Pedosphaera sp. Tous-C6FEB]